MIFFYHYSFVYIVNMKLCVINHILANGCIHYGFINSERLGQYITSLLQFEHDDIQASI